MALARGIKPDQGRSAGRWRRRPAALVQARRARAYLDIARSDASGIMPFHDVMMVRGGRVEAICKGDFRVEWRSTPWGRISNKIVRTLRVA